jgi:tetratricopeptide (TPR) repeat protein
MGWAELRGIRSDKWKYIRAPKPELYDLIHDPAEQSNVIGSHPVESQELEAELKTLSLAGGRDERVSVNSVDARTLGQLKSLGYLSGVSSGEFKLNGQGDDPKDHTDTLAAFQTALGPGSRTIPPARRIEVLRQALASDLTNPSLYFYLAAEYEKAGHYDQAMAVCENAQKQGIWNGRLLSREGDLYLRAGKKQQAIAAYEKAAQIDPSNVESQTNLATAYLEEGRLPASERRFRWVLTLEENAPAYNGLGLIAIQRQDFPAARANFEHAVLLDPNLVEAQLNLGLIYKMAGDIPHAKVCFQTFLAGASPVQYKKIIPQVREELAAMR